MRFSFFSSVRPSMILLFVGLFLYSAAAQALENDLTLDAIAATVQGKAVTCYEVEENIRKLRQQLQQSGLIDFDHKQLYQRALDAQIMQRLQASEAHKLGINIADDEVNSAIKKVAKDNKLDMSQLKEALKAQGIDFDDYRESLKKRMLSNKLIDIAVRGRVKISDEAMREYYRKYMLNPKPVREIRLAQIFRAVKNTSGPITIRQNKQDIEKVRKKLDTGAEFSDLVTLHSQSPDAASGGDMGWFLPGGISPVFAEVFQLPVLGYTHIIRSPAGFHIVKVVEERWHEPELGESYDEVHARHILLKVPTTANEATRAKIMDRAQNIARNMQSVDDDAFATRAKETSQGPSNSRGGDLGWFRKGQMVKAFEDVAFALNAGDTSGVVKSAFGLHIIRVVEKRHINPNSFEARLNQINQVLSNAEMQTQVPRWLASLKAKAVIKTLSCPQLQYATEKSSGAQLQLTESLSDRPSESKSR
ncbi:MAG: peptidylprolyl isomerase [Mariprofundaceae bacterium]|nr:peptidylprolyl isomerase [Mariprofundaceae bacterium]